ncbi:MAG: hypothetical protein IJ071_05100 [Ruminococcus sp.]|nr:hypothetical protein [Ruminococcus sp.]
MLETILGGVGAAALAVGLILTARALILRYLGGAQVLAQVVSCRKSDKGWYRPRVSFLIDGRTVEAESAAEFANEIPAGEERLIIYNKKDPQRFRFADSFRTNLVGTGLLALLGALFVVRFWIL